MFGGAAPDALAALIAMLATLRDAAGNTTVTGLDNTQTWTGEIYPEEQFRSDAGALDGVSLLGDGTVSDMLWARPAITVLGIDAPPVRVRPPRSCRTRPRGSTCASRPGMAAKDAQTALIAHLRAAAPWGVHVSRDRGDRIPVPGGRRRPGVHRHGGGDARGVRNAR